MTPLSNFKNVVRTFLFKQKYPKGFGLLTGNPHLGTDYLVSIGTPIYAWTDNVTIVKAFKGKEGGNTAWVKVAGRPELIRFLHLRELPKLGTYNSGSVFAFSGNTGVSSAPHLHVDVSINGELELNNLNNFSDPEKYFASFNNEDDMKVVDKLASQFKVLVGRDPGDNMNDNEQIEFAEKIKNIQEEITLHKKQYNELLTGAEEQSRLDGEKITALENKITELSNLITQDAGNTSFMTALKFLVKTMKSW